jgi:hypothetical protein
MGIIFKSKTPTPCGHHLHGRHGHSSPMKNRRRFSKFCKNYKTLTSHEKFVSYWQMSLKSSHWSCLRACCEGYAFSLTIFFLSEPPEDLGWDVNEPPKKIIRRERRFIAVPGQMRRFWTLVCCIERKFIFGKNSDKILCAVKDKNSVKPLFMYSIGQKWLYLLRKVLIKSRYGFS